MTRNIFGSKVIMREIEADDQGVSGCPIEVKVLSDVSGGEFDDLLGVHEYAEIETVKKENIKLRQIVDMLSASIASKWGMLAQRLESLEREVHSEVIQLRDIPRDQAKKEIKEFFEKTESPTYYSDVANALHLDLKFVVEICDELKKEGIITIG